MIQKGRPKKIRYIKKMPRILTFSPRGKAGRPDEIQVSLDQWEAIKLADWEGFNQLKAAQIMGVSRATFGRILRDGRKVVADAIVHGKIIKISGGKVVSGNTSISSSMSQEPKASSESKSDFSHHSMER